MRTAAIARAVLSAFVLATAAAVHAQPVFTDSGVPLAGVGNASAAWGDYDGDGDLDLVLTGHTGIANITRIYRNDGGTTFTAIEAGLTGAAYGSAAWGDYDNDGDLDLLVIGYDGTTETARLYRNDGGDVFTPVDTGVAAAVSGSVAWGDYDNDGDLDILLTGATSGGRAARLYRNDGGATFIEVAAGMTGVMDGVALWGDYDNDGDLDILLAGNAGATRVSKVYRNDGGVFTDLGLALPGVESATAAWGDYDQDGRLDFVLAGDDGAGGVFKIYHNDGAGGFSDSGASLPPFLRGSAAWGDADNDGDLDLLISGWSGGLVAKLYRNDGGGAFADTAAALIGLDRGSATWADADNDGDLDILLAGDDGSNVYARLYRNDVATSNTPPSVPAGLTASVTGHTVTLAWNAASDAQTAWSGLGYNLRVGTTPGGAVDVVSPLSWPGSGYRHVVQLGNANQRTTAVLKGLPLGTYYWTVQAIDAAFAGSAFADEGTFSICDFSISPSSVTVGTLGATGSVSVTTQPGCAWTAASNDYWLSVTPGAAGAGSGVVEYLVAGSGVGERTGTLTIAGQTFTVAQHAQGITGTVIDADSGAPLPDVWVYVYDASGNHVGSRVTDSLGHYGLDALPAGTYYAQTYNTASYIDELFDGFPCRNCTPTAGTPIVVNEAALTNASFALRRGGVIRGTVTEEGTGTPLANIQVVVYDLNGDWITSAVTSAEGVYQIPQGLSTGTYRAVTYQNDQGYIDEAYDNVPCPYCSNTTGTPIAITAGTTRTIDFQLVKGGRIAGSVVDDVTGQPLPSVWVEIYNPQGQYVASGYTDVSGAYLTRGGLPAGTYYLRTWNRGGYVNEAYDDVTCAPCSASAGNAVPVTLGQITPDIHFRLRPGGRIAGTVTDAQTGAPLADTQIIVYDAANRWTSSTNPDVSGLYLTGDGLLPGTYRVEARSYLGGYLRQSRTDVVVTETLTTTGIDFAMERGGRIAGRVTDVDSGLPLAGIDVRIYDSANKQVSYGWTDDLGAYISYDGLPAGTYSLRTSNKSGYIDGAVSGIAVNAGATTEGVDLALVRGGRVAGRVTSAGSGGPLGGLWIYVSDSTGRTITSGRTDLNGDYITEAGIPAGTYSVRTWNSNNAYIDQTRTGITAALGATTEGINFALVLGARVSGTVTDANTGLPLAGVWVTASGAAGYASGVSDATGAYTTSRGVASGTYQLSTSNQAGYIEQTRASVTLTAGTTSRVDFALVTGARVSGTITDAVTGAPLRNVNVDVYSGNTWMSYGFTNTSGVYTTGSGLPPGTYRLVTWNMAGYINQERTGVAVTSDVTSVDFALTPGGRIAGTVIDAQTGLPVPSYVTVNVYDAARQWITSGDTDASGAYIVEGGLPEGTYSVETSNRQLYVNQARSGVPVVGTGTTGGIDFALAKGGSITGKVIDADTGDPVPNLPIDVYDATNRSLTRAFTSSDGVYVTRLGLATGTYRLVTVNSAGYLDQARAGVVVTQPATTENVDFALVKGGLIAGVITDADSGVGVEGVHVNVYDAGNQFVTYGVSASTGAYVTRAGLPTGTYRASTSHAPADYINQARSGIDVTQPATTAGVNLALARGGRISGRVTSAGAGAPLAGVWVNVNDAATNAWRGNGQTNAAGVYLVSQALPPGSYRVSTSNTAGYVEQSRTGIMVAAGVTTTGVDFALVAGARFSGAVTEAGTGTALGGVNVSVTDALGNGVAWGTTNAQGQYQTTALPPGRYRLFTAAMDGVHVDEVHQDIPWLAWPWGLGGTFFDLGAGQNETVNFELAVGGEVRGRVTNAATGNGIPDITVWIYETGPSGRTDANGDYTITGLPAGRYRVHTRNGSGYLDEFFGSDVWILNPGDWFPTPLVDVALGAATTGIDLALPAGARFQGTVRDEATTALLSGIVVEFFNESGYYVTSAITDSAGHFVSRSGVAPGTYYARTENKAGYVNECYGGMTCTPRPDTVVPDAVAIAGTPIVVTAPGLTASVDFVLAKGGRIAGSSRNAVRIVDAANRTVANVTPNGQTGRYLSEQGFPAGTYYVISGNEVFDGVSCLGCTPSSAGTPVTVSVGVTTEDVDFDPPSGTGAIGGRVVDAATGAPVTAVVQAWNAAGVEVGNGYTDPSGGYGIVGLPPGTYFLKTITWSGHVDRSYGAGPCGQGCKPHPSAVPVVVDAGAGTTGIDFALGTAGTIAGRVTGAGGRPLPGVEVAIFDATGVPVTTAYVQSDGHYLTWNSLPDGVYYARTRNLLGLADRLWNGQACAGSCDVTQGTPITIAAAAAVTDIDFSLSTSACTYSIDPTLQAFPAGGGSGSLNVSTNSPSCTWSAVSNDPWLTLTSPGSGTGAGSVSYTVAGTNGPARTGTLSVGGRTFTVAQASGCAVALDPTSATAIAAGGSGTVDVTANDAACTWTAESNDAWLGITSGASGSGNGSVTYSVEANLGPARTGSLTIAGRTFSVAQGSGCTFAIDPASQSFGIDGGSGTTVVTVNAPACSWTAVSRDPWITLTSVASGTGNGSVSFSVGFNGTGADRTGSLTVAGQTFSVTQQGTSVIFFSQPTYSVGEAGLRATITVKRAGDLSAANTVDVVTADGTAAAGADYTPTSVTLSFAPGVAIRSVTIPILNDLFDESDETVDLRLINFMGPGTLGQSTAVLTIQDNDVAGVVRFTAAEYGVSEGLPSVTIRVTRTAGGADGVTVDYATANGTAQAGADYTAATGRLFFGAGVTVQTFTVPILADTLDEANETLSVTLSQPAGGATLGTPQAAVVTITDNDVAGVVQLGAASYSISEGAGTATITVTRSGGTAGGVTVAYATADGTAEAGSDYTSTSGVLSFGANVLSQSFEVPVLDDALGEGNETLTVELREVTGNATLGVRSSAPLSIIDDEPQPAVYFSAASYNVIEAGVRATITVRRQGDSATPVSVAFATVAGGSATAGSDYTPAAGTLTFAPGVMSQTFVVPVANDTLDEDDETVALALSAPTGGAVLGTQATAELVINDNDTAGVLRFSAATYAGAEGLAGVRVTVTRSGGLAGGVTVAYATADGTAVDGADYERALGVLTFGAGVTSQAFTVPILNDTLDEPSETVNLFLGDATGGAALAAPTTAVLTIADNDAAGVVQLSAASYTVGEGGGTATITVTRSGGTASGVTVDYMTLDGTAHVGSDYASTSGTLLFTANAQSLTFQVPILNDAAAEGGETFGVRLSNVGGGASLGTRTTGGVTIVDDETQPSFYFDTPRFTVSEAGVRATVTVRRHGNTSSPGAVSYSTADGTATATADYAATNGLLFFAAGVTQRTFTVAVVNDSVDEDDETVALALSAPSGGVLGTQSTAVLTLTDNDAAGVIRFSAAQYAVVENQASIRITVSRSSGLASDVTVAYATADGTASAGLDYFATSGVLTFGAGMMSRTFTVPILNDTLDEPSETVTLTLSSPGGGATLGTPSTARLTIVDNDPAGPVAPQGERRKGLGIGYPRSSSR